MKWKVVVRPEAEDDAMKAADWYDEQRAGLGGEFTGELAEVLDSLALNPLRRSKKHPRLNVRWLYPKRFPYRIIYEVREAEHLVIVAAVLHAARDERFWRARFR